MNNYKIALKATEQMIKDFEKLKAKYAKKLNSLEEKEPPYVLVEGEKCYTDKDIFGWYEAGYISSRKYDNLMDKLRKLQEENVDNDRQLLEIELKMIDKFLSDLRYDKRATERDIAEGNA